MGITFQCSWSIKSTWGKNHPPPDPSVSLSEPIQVRPGQDAPSPKPPLPFQSDFVFDFPNEIQHMIFTIAATDARCARALALVSHYVHRWYTFFTVNEVRPELTLPPRVVSAIYQRVVISSSQSALCLLDVIRSKPRGYFRNIVKSMAFDYPVQLRYAKPLLAECSHSIISFTCFTSSDNQSSYLPFIRSPHLRRLNLIYKPNFARPIPREAPYNSITPEITSSLTHLVIVINYPHGLWRNLYFASMAQHSEAEQYQLAYASFQNLTHFAISHSRWMSAIPLKHLAKNLRYFVVLEPTKVTRLVHSFLVVTVSKFQDQRLFLMKDFGEPDSWNPEECWTASSFWTRVESFVDGGYLSDQGDRWVDHLKGEPAGTS